jgi:hypothetical protein
VHKKQLAAGLLALTLTTALAACADDAEPTESSESSESSEPTESGEESTELEPLTDEQVQQALLSETVMGPDFTGAVPEEEEDNPAPGCLAALDDLDDLGAETEAKIEYTSTSEVGAPTLEHSVFSYTETDPITERIEQISTALDGCTSVQETDEEGTEYDLDVAMETEVTAEGADEQITLQAIGTVGAEGQEFALGVYMSSVRVENNVSVVIYSDIPEDEAASASDFEAYVNAATERLVTVAAGEEPAEEPLA